MIKLLYFLTIQDMKDNLLLFRPVDTTNCTIGHTSFGLGSLGHFASCLATEVSFSFALVPSFKVQCLEMKFSLVN